MAFNINSVGALKSVIPPDDFMKSDSTEPKGLINFADFLTTSLNELNDLKIEADKARNDFAIGKNDNIHQVLIAGERASIATSYVMQVRDKVIEAYNEIMRIQI